MNVNILTHLEYYRVLKLVEGGKTVAEAKKQAQKEILAVFGINGDGFDDSEDMSIFGTSEGDAALLAISILLQGDLSEGEFSQRLTNFAQSIRENGSWSDEDRGKLVNGFDYNGIKNSILSWELSSEIPDYEKYVKNYMVSFLGECTEENWQLFVKKYNMYCWLTWIPEKNNCYIYEWYSNFLTFPENDCTEANEGETKEIRQGADNYYVPFTCRNNNWVNCSECNISGKKCVF